MHQQRDWKFSHNYLGAWVYMHFHEVACISSLSLASDSRMIDPRYFSNLIGLDVNAVAERAADLIKLDHNISYRCFNYLDGA